MRKYLLLLLFSLQFWPLLAQSNSSVWPPLREADIASARRVHRIVDVRNKENRELAWPKAHFGQLMWNAAMSGKLKVYEPRKDSFLRVVMDPEDITGIVSPLQRIQIPRLPESDPAYDPFDVKDTIVRHTFDPLKQLLKYEIVEDWVTDKKSGASYVRIVAVAPLMDRVVAGVTLSNQPIFWVRYNASMTDSMVTVRSSNYACLRELNVKYRVFDRMETDTATTSLDTYFEKRRYTGFIIRENDNTGQYLREQDATRDNSRQLQQNSQQIREGLIKNEQDLWGN